jgi:hypothetical protein
MHAVGPVQPPADLIDGAWLRLDGVGIESRDPANPDRVMEAILTRAPHPTLPHEGGGFPPGTCSSIIAA